MANAARNLPRVGAQRPGGRAARVRTDVLAATAELLETVGYDELTYDEVAQRAGVHRTTVYRRWPTKPELVADAISVHSDGHVPIPETGSLRSDLRTFAFAVAANISSPGGARRSRSIVAGAATSEQLAARMNVLMTRRVALAESILDQAAARGEVAEDLDRRVYVEAVIAPIWFRLLLSGEPIDDTFLDAVVDLVTRAAVSSGHAT